MSLAFRAVRRSVLPGDGHAVLCAEDRRAHVHVDGVLLHQEADALHQPVGHLAAALDRRGVIELEAADLEAELLAALAQGVGHVGIPEQRLGRDAADVQAHAAQPLPVDDSRLLAELCGPDGTHVAARSGADHDDVVVRHSRSPGRFDQVELYRVVPPSSWTARAAPPLPSVPPSPPFAHTGWFLKSQASACGTLTTPSPSLGKGGNRRQAQAHACSVETTFPRNASAIAPSRMR